jgi:hypothetical protein
MPEIHPQPIPNAKMNATIHVEHMTENTWYVSFRSKPRPGRRVTRLRLAETFLTEREAKRCAEAKIRNASDVSAGTLDPHLPKRTIAPAEIAEWLREGSLLQGSNDARRSWTITDDSQLGIRMAAGDTAPEIASKLGRTTRAIRRRAEILKLLWRENRLRR